MPKINRWRWASNAMAAVIGAALAAKGVAFTDWALWLILTCAGLIGVFSAKAALSASGREVKDAPAE